MSLLPYPKLDEYRLARDNGASLDDVNQAAKMDGYSVIQRIWILNQLFGLSISESKEYVITQEEGGLEKHTEWIKSIIEDFERESDS
jgi:hypothetical protein